MRTKKTTLNRRAVLRRRVVGLTIWSMLFAPLTGCSRTFWRDQAERDSYDALNERQTDERWTVPRLSIEPDERSRFYNPYHPDHTPLPPDDPAAEEYMRQVNGTKGYKSWHKLGRAMSLENPQWLQPYGIELNSEGDPVAFHNQLVLNRLTLPDALELSYIHSRDYQTQIENTYLSALALTFQRFRFDVRYLGIGGGRPTTGATASVTPNNSQGLGGGDSAVNIGTSRFGVRQLLPSGAQWAVELANNSLVVFGSGGATASTLSYSLTQPLLAGAGRKITLENLTQQEREVLYSVRDLARFRKTFFGQTTISYLNLLEQRQNVLNQLGNIDRLNEQIEIRQAQDNRPESILTEALTIPAAEINIPEQIADRLRVESDEGMTRVLRWVPRAADDPKPTAEEIQLLLGASNNPQYQAAARQIVSRLRTKPINLSTIELRTRLNSSFNTLQNAENRISDLQDAFKLQLGLPPDVKLTVDDSLLKQFELIGPDLVKTEQELKRIQQEEFSNINDQNVDYARLQGYVQAISKLADQLADAGPKQTKARMQKVQDLLNGTNGTGRSFKDEAERERVLADFERDNLFFDVNRDEFETFRQTLTDTMELVKYPTVEEAMQARGAINGSFELGNLPKYWDEALRKSADADESKDISQQEYLSNIFKVAGDIRENLVRLAQEFQVIDIGSSVETLDIIPFTLAGGKEAPTIEEAIAIGLDNRLDLMNARATVTDARRAVEIAANALESVLDVQVSGGVSTPTIGGGNKDPFRFQNDNSNHQVGIGFTAPVDQISERNAYNQSIILYERERRAYMAFEDQIKNQIRQNWRSLNVLKSRLEIDRQTIRNAALQYQQAASEASRAGGGGGSFSILNALQTILSAQNSLIGNWFSYERARIRIFQDMGIMNIDQRGLWEDNFYQQLATSGGSVPSSADSFIPPASISIPGQSDPAMNGTMFHFEAPQPLDGTFPQGNEKLDAYSHSTAQPLIKTKPVIRNATFPKRSH